jgi:protein-S-isoprenylcysteine O-methyltransferase Ste14
MFRSHPRVNLSPMSTAPPEQPKEAPFAAAPGAKSRRWIRSPIRRKNIRPRVLAPVAAALLAWLFARPSPQTLALGSALVAAGAALRIWATGYLVKTDELTVAGPYAHLRHPLYAGSLLIGLGLLVAAGHPVLTVGAPLGLGFFFLYYLPYKERRESARLRERHGAPFESYRSAVRPLWPRLRPYPGASKDARWSLDQVVDNDEFGTTLTASLALLAVALRLLF